jgi:hypothetical protein
MGLLTRLKTTKDKIMGNIIDRLLATFIKSFRAKNPTVWSIILIVITGLYFALEAILPLITADTEIHNTITQIYTYIALAYGFVSSPRVHQITEQDEAN